MVVAGQELAHLDQTEAYGNVRKAAEQVEQARAAVTKAYAGETDEAIAVAEAAVAVTQALLTAAEVALANATEAQEETQNVGAATVATAQVTLDESVDALADTKAQEAENVVQAQSMLVSALNSTVIEVRSALSTADEILGIDNVLANNDFESMLSVTNAQALVSAKNAYEAATKTRDAAEESPTEANVLAALEDAAATLLYVRQALDATTIDSADFTFEDLSAKKAGVDAERVALQTEAETLLASEQAVTDANLAQTTAVNAAQHAYASAVQALAASKATQTSNDVAAAAAVRSAQASVSSRRAELQQAQAALAQTQAAPRWVDIAGLEAEVQAAQAALSVAQAQLEKTRLVSPIDGVVSRVDMKPGELASAGARVVTVQTTDEHRFKLVLDVPEADIALVHLDAAADVTFDAFGSGVHAAGSVVKIDPAEKLIEGVVFYEVTVYLNDGLSIEGLKPGMSSDVTILAATREATLVVPARAVLARTDGSRYVRVVNAAGTSFVERDVNVGLRGDEGKMELLDGVSEGEVIVVAVIE
jgi:multidrug efflux pump subunit AcrA (membrane-fusion protein)